MTVLTIHGAEARAAFERHKLLLYYWLWDVITDDDVPRIPVGRGRRYPGTFAEFSHTRVLQDILVVTNAMYHQTLGLRPNRIKRPYYVMPFAQGEIDWSTRRPSVDVRAPGLGHKRAQLKLRNDRLRRMYILELHRACDHFLYERSHRK